MQGPIAASSDAGDVPLGAISKRAATALATTLETMPRQPAWTAATADAPGALMRMGMQSAMRTETQRVESAVTIASAF